jgi:predicted aspartyl protease
MVLNLEHYFEYPGTPGIPVKAINPKNGKTVEFDALVDTGADGTLLDLSIAMDLDIDFADSRIVRISGVGGEVSEARSTEIEIELLRLPDLRASIRATFAPNVAQDYGNLLGVNVLSIFDIGVAHSRRTIYLGRAPQI